MTSRFEEPAEDVSLKSFGLAVLSLIVEHLEDSDVATPGSPFAFTQAEKESILAPAIVELAEYATSLPPKSLFDNWAPSAGRHAIPLLLQDYNPEQHLGRAADGSGSVATASSNKSDKTSASKALSDGSTEAWSSVNDATTSWWQLQLKQPTYLQYAQLTWRTESTVKSTPESYTVSVSVDGQSWSQIGPAIALDSLSKSEMARQRIAIDTACTFIRVDMKGYSKGLAEAPGAPSSAPGKSVPQPKEKAHGIASFKLFVPDSLSIHVAPSTTLFEMEKMLLGAAMSTGNNEELGRSLRALQSLSLASGSTQGLLKLMTALVALQEKQKLLPGDSGNDDVVPDKFLSLVEDGPSAVAAAKLSLKTLPKDNASQAALDSFIRGLDEATNAELETLLLPQVASIISGSGGDALGGSGGLSSGPLRAAFDPLCMSGGMSLSEGDTHVRSTNGGKNCVYGTQGFSRGQVAWEFNVVEDSHGDEHLW
jgi:F5/8 type C domain